MSKSIKSLTANVTASAVALATAGGTFADALNATVRATVALAVAGKGWDAAHEVAKSGYGYADADEQKRQSFRKVAQYGKAITEAWPSLSAAQRKDFTSGKLLPYSLFKSLKPASTSTSGKAANDTAPAPAPATASQAAQAISPCEGGLQFAKWLETADPAKMTKAQAKAFSEVRRAIEAFTAKASAQAKTPARKAA